MTKYRSRAIQLYPENVFQTHYDCYNLRKQSDQEKLYSTINKFCYIYIIFFLMTTFANTLMTILAKCLNTRISRTYKIILIKNVHHLIVSITIHGFI